MNIYWEQQNGGLCRLHALNAFFGKHMITPQQFNDYQLEYNIWQKKKFKNSFIDCKNFDALNSDQNNIITYLLKYKFKVFTKYFSINESQKYNKINSSLDYSLDYIISNLLDKISNKFIFIYNHDHIWGIKYKSDKWYKIDSLSGVSIINNIYSEINRKNVGFIIPICAKFIFVNNINKIKKILSNYNKNILLNISEPKLKKEKLDLISNYLKSLHNNDLILGELELYLNIVVEILDIFYDGEYCSQIINIVERHKEFTLGFNHTNYLNISYILKFIPNILYNILSFFYIS